MNEARVRHVERYWWMLAIVLMIALVVVFQQMQLRTSKRSVQISQELQLLRSARYALAEVSEAQNGAVLASADSERELFVAQAKKASAELSDAMSKLTRELSHRRTPDMDGRLQTAARTLSHFEDLHSDLVGLATQNSNYRAYSLAYGPMIGALQTIDQALTQVIDRHAELSAADDQQSYRSSNEARAGALRIYSLLVPHIAEKEDAKMNELEASIEQEEQRVTKNLQTLTSLKIVSDSLDLEKAESAWKEFYKLRSEIIPLSRLNTNLRSARLALNERRAAMLAMEDSLAAIESALESEQHTSIVSGGR